MMEMIAKETGAEMGGALYSDALSEPSGSAPPLHRHVPRQRAEARVCDAQELTALDEDCTSQAVPTNMPQMTDRRGSERRCRNCN